MRSLVGAGSWEARELLGLRVGLAEEYTESDAWSILTYCLLVGDRFLVE